jgi:hypothetical protein
MNITWKKSGTIFLLACALAGSSTAFAQSWESRSQNDGQQGRRPSNERADNSRQADQSKRDSKLSPDERRALRRQIDEAGRDIYTPRR